MDGCLGAPRDAGVPATVPATRPGPHHLAEPLRQIEGKPGQLAFPGHFRSPDDCLQTEPEQARSPYSWSRGASSDMQRAPTIFDGQAPGHSHSRSECPGRCRRPWTAGTLCMLDREATRLPRVACMMLNHDDRERTADWRFGQTQAVVCRIPVNRRLRRGRSPASAWWPRWNQGCRLPTRYYGLRSSGLLPHDTANLQTD